MNQVKVNKFEARLNELYKMRKAQIVEVAMRQHKIFNTNCSKDILVSEILEAEFGRKFMSEINK